VVSLIWVSSDDAENRGVILCLAAQEPSPMAGAAEGV